MTTAQFSLVLEQLFPGRLGGGGKNRLRTALLPFRPDAPPEPSEYYLDRQQDCYLQGDLFPSIRQATWTSATGQYRSKYGTAMLLSNSCDLSDDNARGITKEAMFAPVTGAHTYFARLAETAASSAATYKQLIKQQEISTLLFLPAPPGQEAAYPQGLIVELDRVFWFPISELVALKVNLLPLRLGTLSTWAHYLLLVKSAYHLCRPPEEPDRPAYS